MLFLFSFVFFTTKFIYSVIYRFYRIFKGTERIGTAGGDENRPKRRQPRHLGLGMLVFFPSCFLLLTTVFLLSIGSTGPRYVAFFSFVFFTTNNCFFVIYMFYECSMLFHDRFHHRPLMRPIQFDQEFNPCLPETCLCTPQFGHPNSGMPPAPIELRLRWHVPLSGIPL
jgi:hypothetical protein